MCAVVYVSHAGFLFKSYPSILGVVMIPYRSTAHDRMIHGRVMKWIEQKSQFCVGEETKATRRLQNFRAITDLFAAEKNNRQRQSEVELGGV